MLPTAIIKMPNKIISKRSGAPVFHFSQKDL